MSGRTPYIRLQEDEERGRATCGCELRNLNGGPALWLCPLHEAAEKLLQVCKLAKWALDLNDQFGDEIDRRHAVEEKAWHLLSQAIWDAEGKTTGRKG